MGLFLEEETELMIKGCSFVLTLAHSQVELVQV